MIGTRAAYGYFLGGHAFCGACGASCLCLSLAMSVSSKGDIRVSEALRLQAMRCSSSGSLHSKLDWVQVHRHTGVCPCAYTWVYVSMSIYTYTYGSIVVRQGYRWWVHRQLLEQDSAATGQARHCGHGPSEGIRAATGQATHAATGHASHADAYPSPRARVRIHA